VISLLHTLFGDLVLLVAAADDGLQHLVWTHMGLEVARVPELTNQLSKPLHQYEHLISRCSLDAHVVLLTQEIVAYRSDVR